MGECMNQIENDILGYKIVGILFLLIGMPLTIIGGVLIGAFFLYPLGTVIPEDQYIIVFEEEFTILATILGFGILLLIISFCSFSAEVIQEINKKKDLKRINNAGKISRNISINNKSEKELDSIMRKNILSER